MSFKKTIYKIFHWEFWPIYMFYFPNAYYVIYHIFKEKSWTFFTLTNPGIENSGIGTESKYKTLQLIPEFYLPKTIFHSKKSSITKTLKELEAKKIAYPLIAKPDIGFRGLLVKKINSENELIHYLKKYKINIIIQEFINYKNECGLFFIRHPKNTSGKITSITLKECPTIIGDGVETILTIIKKNKHLSLFEKQIAELTSIDLNSIPNKDEVIQLTSIGNQAKGTKFINGNHLISDSLNLTINKLNHQIKGWFYGRLDIKYNNWEDVINGNFKIIELNGILAEPTHIYDTKKNNYWKAISTFKQHWKDLYDIASYNHTTLKIPYKSRKLFFSDLKKLRNYSKKVKSLAQ